MVEDMQSALDLFTFFEKTPDLVCIAYKDGYFRKVNAAVVTTLGYSEAELYSRTIDSFIHPDDRVRTIQNRKNLLEGQVLHNFHNRYITKSGDTVWLDWTSLYFPEKEFVLALARNITNHKLLHDEAEINYRKFKGLAKHFKSSIEKDRKYLAYELHEDLAQLAAGMKMELEAIPLSMTDLPEAAVHKLSHVTGMATRLIKTIQRLSFSISPAMLHELGLNETLEWLCREFTILSSHSCKFISDYNGDDLSQEVKTDFFRICQEALANVMNHAKATETIIHLYDEDNTIRLHIEDNGQGFDEATPTGGTGIVNMRERTASINGTLHINSDLGVGTQVCVSIAKKSGT